MADMDLTVNVNTAPAQREIQKFQNGVEQLNNRVEKLNDTFMGMRNAIAGLAIGALIQRSIAFADAISDIADATGIATEKIMGFSQAVTLSGGSSEQANDGILKLVNAISQAAEGSKQAQDAFKSVGVSINDLRTLSEEDIFEKTIQGLAKIEDTSKRAGLSAELLGKSFRGVNLQNVAQSYGPAIAQQREYAKAVESAAELQDKLDRTFIRIQSSILKAIEPITKFVGSLDEQKIQSVIDSLIQMTTVLAGLGIALKSLEWVGKVWLVLTSVTLAFGAGIMGLKKTIGIFVWQWGKLTADLAKGTALFTALGTTVSTVATKRLPHLISALGLITKGFLGWAGILWLLNDAIKAVTGSGIIGWFEKLTGIVPSIASINQGLETFYRTLGTIASFAPNTIGKILGIESLENMGNVFTMIADKLKNIREGMINEAADEAEIQRLKNKAAGQEEINKNLAKQAARAKELRDVEDQRAKAFAQFKFDQKANVENYQEGLRLTMQQLAFENSLIGKSEEQKEILRAQNGLLNNQITLVNNLQNQIDKLRLDASLGLDDQANAKIKVLQDSIRQIQGYTAQATEDVVRYYNAAQTAKAVEEDRLRTLENITKAYDDQVTRTQTLGDQLKGVGQQISDAMFEGTQIGQSPIEQQIAKIKRDAEQAALAAQRAFAETFGGEDLGPGREAELLAGLDQIKTKFEELAQVQANNARANLEYSRSWAGGWNEAFSEYTNNAMSAATAARDAFQAVTGNMNSAIDNFVSTGKFKFSDFAESIIQDLIKIELKAAASKVLSPILGAVGTGLKSILGFAEGGNPPINKPSIVGEKGPELFVPKTAGTVVPNNALGGQAQVTNNYITNNISAVDAKSVAQLFAENRRTLFGTVKLAEKELSYR